MEQASWQARFDRRRRPGLSELEAFFSPAQTERFRAMAEHLHGTCGVHAAPPVYTVQRGWTFRFGHSGVYLVEGVFVDGDAFVVGPVRVEDDASLRAALAYLDALYADGFPDRLRRVTEGKKARQRATTQARVARERAELEAMQAQIVPERFNRYRWPDKVRRRDLARLYSLDARGIADEALADEIGYTLYARCMEGGEVTALIASGRLRCHGCGEMLPYRQGLMQCACGRQYLFRDYMRAFRANNMPSGSALEIFGDFVKRWPAARGYGGKMRLIDDLVHAFHMNLITGVKGRFVAINLVEGTKGQIADLILSLASADWNADTKAAFAGAIGRPAGDDGKGEDMTHAANP